MDWIVGQARRTAPLAALVCFIVLLAGPTMFRSQEDPPGDDRPLYDPDSILVRFGLDELAKLDPIMYELTLGLVGGESAKQYRIVPGLELIRLNKGELKVSVEEAIERLKILPYVKYVEPDYYLYPLDTPDDPLFEDQWHLHNTGQSGGTSGADINAPEAWSILNASTERIAVLDTGAILDHEDLEANIWTNSGETPGDNQDNDFNGYVDDIHGYTFVLSQGQTPGDPTDPGSPTHCPSEVYSDSTFVSSIISAETDNAVGVVGVLWSGEIVVLRVLDTNPAFPVGEVGMVSAACGALEYCVDNTIRMSNNSYRLFDPTGNTLYDAIEAPRA